jgi:hypothetical protein
MKDISVKTEIFSPRVVALQTALALAVMVLTACGGGGSSSDSSSSTDSSSSDSATASVVPTESAQAMDAVMTTSQSLIASSNAGSGLTCPGGGTASYTLTGTDNKAIESGEIYAFTFVNCKGAAGAIAVNGSATMTVTTVTAGLSAKVYANLTLTQLQAVLPLSTVTLNGVVSANSTFLYKSGSSAGSSLDSSLTASGLAVSRATASRTVSYTVNALNLSQLSYFDGSGNVTSSQVSGSATLSTSRPAGTFSATLSMTSAVTFSGGIPTSGQWVVTLPTSSLTANASNGSLSVAVDLGKNGSVDYSHTFVPGTWASSVE